MRLWSLHPKYLDAPGLTALWREALLARHVLRGRTRGYRHHPQLARFRAAGRPIAAINTYLAAVQQEAARRGYRFDPRKIGAARTSERVPVARGQVAYEWAHLRRKLAARDPEWLRSLPREWRDPHPLFRVVPGPMEPWERPDRPTGGGPAPRTPPADGQGPQNARGTKPGELRTSMRS